MTLIAFILGCVVLRTADSVGPIGTQMLNDAICTSVTATGIAILMVPSLLVIPKSLTAQTNCTNAVAQAVLGGARD